MLQEVNTTIIEVITMILFTSLVLALAVGFSQGTPGCMTGDAETAMLECSVEDIVYTIIEADFSALVGDMDLGDADIASPCGKARYLANILKAADSPLSDCVPEIADATGDVEDNLIEDPVEEINEPAVDDVGPVDENPEEQEQTDVQTVTGEEVTEPPVSEVAEVECYTDEEGADYYGEISTTQSGLTCQMWSETSPHRPLNKYKGFATRRRAIMYPRHFGEHNHCRNLGTSGPRSSQGGSTRTGIWCYTADPDVRWEYCVMPQISVDCPQTPE